MPITITNFFLYCEFDPRDFNETFSESDNFQKHYDSITDYVIDSLRGELLTDKRLNDWFALNYKDVPVDEYENMREQYRKYFKGLRNLRLPRN